MIRFIILLLIICACVYGYQNFETIKSSTLNSIQNEKTIKKFNFEKNQNSKDIENALKF